MIFKLSAVTAQRLMCCGLPVEVIEAEQGRKYTVRLTGVLSIFFILIPLEV